MNPFVWHKVAAVSGMAALGCCSYGAYGFKLKNPVYKEVWQTVSLYHLVHTVVLVAAPVTKYPNIASSVCLPRELSFPEWEGSSNIILATK